MNFTFLHTPKFLSTSLHLMTCVELPVHIFGAYIILTKTPDSMKSVKWSMLNLHIWSMLLDISVSLLATPFILFPAIAGYPLGLLKEFGVSPAAQVYLVGTMFAFVGVSILGIFENRFYVMFAENSSWKHFRVPLFVVNYFLAVALFIPPCLDTPDQKIALEEVYKILPPNPPPWITDGPVFVLATNLTFSFFTVFIFTVFIVGEINIFIALIGLNTRCLKWKMTLSQTTLKMQQRFLNAIRIQMYMPLLILIFPLLYISYSVYYISYNQAANNICFMMISFHGLASTLIMLLIHKSYREVCIGMFCVRLGSKEVESKRNSIGTSFAQKRNSVLVVSHKDNVII